MAISEIDKEILDRIDKFHEFYRDAWGKLLTVISIGFVIVAMAMPVVLTLIQNHSFKKEVAAVKRELGEAQKKRLDEAEEKLRLEIFKATEDKIEGIKAGTFHVQAVLYLKEGYCSVATSSLVSASLGYLRAGDERNLQTALVALYKNCLPEIRKSDFEEDENLESDIEGLLSKLSEANTNGKYSNYISEIKRALKEARKRK